MMRPIRAGDRGPAVEDIQQRLLLLGYDLGPAGIDGVLLGHTLAAITQFQADRGLRSDGLVGDTTWAALVDATFTFGDRMLYLRVPHLHGRDVRVLQEALGVLGFSCATDGIFGPRTERALREFQRNVAIPADGVVGLDTVRTLMNLRHLWEGKSSHAPVQGSETTGGVARVLERTPIALRPEDAAAQELAARVANLALAITDDARTGLLGMGEVPYEGTAVLVRITGGGMGLAVPGVPLVLVGDSGAAALASRMRTALAASGTSPREVLVDVSPALPAERGDEREAQQAAVLLLDALCAALD